MLRLTPLSGRTFGALCEGVDLKRDVPEATIKTIKESLAKHRLLIFRDQGRIDGQRQVDISEWFGRVQSTFSKHPRSPHPDVFRVSNDPSEGCTSVRRSGWHIDGTFMPKVSEATRFGAPASNSCSRSFPSHFGFPVKLR